MDIQKPVVLPRGDELELFGEFAVEHLHLECRAHGHLHFLFEVKAARDRVDARGMIGEVGRGNEVPSQYSCGAVEVVLCRRGE